MDVSVFRSVGIGIVAENKSLMSHVIAWYPHEWQPMRDGEIASNAVKTEYQAVDASGASISGSMTTDNTLMARWFPGTSNRLTPPNVRRGVKVEIFQVADDDEYYWQDMGLDAHLSKLETIIIGISANPDEKLTREEALSPANMYWIEFSSHSKKLAFSSAKANNEPFKYEAFFDFDKGEFSINDDIGNFINLVSELSLIHLENDKGSFVKLDKNDVKVYAPQDIKADAKKNVSINAGQNIDIKAGVQVVINAAGTVQTMNASGTVLKTPKYDILT